MSAGYNQKLYALVSATALIECVIPVIICDENFRVCMISQSARGVFRPIAIGKDMSRMFSGEELDVLSTLVGASLAEPTIGGYNTPVITVGGTLQGERYIAIIIEPQAMFKKVSGPWYVDEALTSVSDALSQLITAERSDTKHLEWSCAMLSRLTEFTQRQQEGVLYSAVSSGDVYTELDIVMEESVGALAAIGASVRYSKDVCKPFSTSVQPFHVYLTATTLICALALVSSNGILSVDCRLDTDGKFLDISLTASTDLTGDIPKSFDGLISYVPHLYLELAAVKDLASTLGILLECEGADSTLTLRVRIPADTSGTVKFRAADIVDAATVRARMLSMCEHIRYNR